MPSGHFIELGFAEGFAVDFSGFLEGFGLFGRDELGDGLYELDMLWAVILKVKRELRCFEDFVDAVSALF